MRGADVDFIAVRWWTRLSRTVKVYVDRSAGVCARLIAPKDKEWPSYSGCDDPQAHALLSVSYQKAQRSRSAPQLFTTHGLAQRHIGRTAAHCSLLIAASIKYRWRLR